jgi:hypothetical protein
MRKLFGILLDVAFLLVSLSTNPQAANAVRTLVVVLCGVAVALGGRCPVSDSSVTG